MGGSGIGQYCCRILGIGYWILGIWYWCWVLVLMIGYWLWGIGYWGLSIGIGIGIGSGYRVLLITAKNLLICMCVQIFIILSEESFAFYIILLTGGALQIGKSIFRCYRRFQ